MNSEQVREKFKGNPKLKRLVDWLIMNQVETRPRWYIRFLAPLYQHRGKHSVIHRSVRMDTPPTDNSDLATIRWLNRLPVSTMP